MYLLYLDDSGSSANINEEHLVLGGVIVFERQIHWIESELNELAKEVDPDNPDDVEFHASEIFSGRIHPWNQLTNKEERINVILKVLSILSQSHETTQALACAVHKQSFTDTDPMEIAFEELCNRFDLHLKYKYRVIDEAHRGIIIVDKSSYETSLQRLALDFKRHGTRWRSIVNLAEAPMFIDSKVSRLIQLADHIAYAVFRRYEAKDSKYLDTIINRFLLEEGKLHGLVHKYHSPKECLCRSCISRA